MSDIKGELKGVDFLPTAFKAWLYSAPPLLALAAFYLFRSEAGSVEAGIISSALSFLTALFSGACAVRHATDRKIYAALLSATAIITMLLTAGFIIKGAELQSSGVLSVVSFTYAGCLVGAVFFGGRPSARRKRRKTKLT